jgi:hypothetical protein
MKKAANTSASPEWKEFEADVRRLLAMQGWEIQSENIMGHKKVDSYAEKTGEFGRRRKLAVECKHYSSQMTQAQVTEIYANYLPLIEQNFIDQVLLVTLNDIAPSAKTFANDSKKLIHITYMELLNSLINFSTYVRGLINQYSQDSLDEYYVSQNYQLSGVKVPLDLKNYNNIETTIMDWIDSSDYQPIAILASYGMGKTTLARRLSYLQALKYSRWANNRIPILIKLEDIASEQSLEGLLGRHFTTNSVAAGYNFDILMELNKKGRFVFILDGFDEMKQTMSWEVMRFNFSQLNRLIIGKSKVIIAGRPSAFLNEEEYLEALSGKRLVMGQLREIPDWPEYKEYYLQPFTNKQIKQFIETYAKVLSLRPTNRSREVNATSLANEIESPKNSELLNLAQRPVQLKMIVEVLPSWEKGLDALTLTALYSEFIDLIIRREMGKRTRQRFSLTQRREFATNLAYFMWSKGLGVGITLNTIPENLFKLFDINTDSLDEIKRDLLSACFLEVKKPEGFYFPHRSFQEYLVAEKILSLLNARSFPFNEPLRINPEIQEFLVGQMGHKDIAKFKDDVWSYQGTMQDWVIDVLLKLIDNPEGHSLFEPQKLPSSPWVPVIISTGLIKQRWTLTTEEKNKLLGACFMKPPVKCAHRANWLKLLVLLTILHKQDLEEMDVDFEARLMEVMIQAGTFDRFGDSKKIRVSEIIAYHTNPRYCHLQSWFNLSDAEMEEVYDLRRAIGKTEVWKEYNFPNSRKKWPHKKTGVTRKRDYGKKV